MEIKEMSALLDNKIQENGLTKGSIDFEVQDGKVYFTKMKSVCVLEDEDAADELVDAVRQNQNFISVEKKYKQGKANKQGEIVRPDIWSVTAKEFL